MCGILVSQNIIGSLPVSLLSRGRDTVGSDTIMVNGKTLHFYHALHRMVGDKKQPIRGRGLFMANCEIYNWKELRLKYGVSAHNDAELLFNIMEGIENIIIENNDDYVLSDDMISLMNNIEGSYAVVYARDDRLYAFRDPMGIRQLCYDNNSMSIASIPQILSDINISNPIILHPRKMIVYHKNNTSMVHIPLSFPINTDDFITELESAVHSRIPDEDYGILFSGGIDSLLIAKIASNHDRKPLLINVSTPNSHDRKAAVEAATLLGLELRIVEPLLDDLLLGSKIIGEGMNENNALKILSGLPTWTATRYANSIGLRSLLTGFGADEILAGYHRSKNNIQRESERFSLLLSMWESNLLKEDVSSMQNTVEIRYPYLSRRVISSAWKHSDDDPKMIIRLGLDSLGIPSHNKKVASHYGSGIKKIISKHTKNVSGLVRDYGSGRRIASLISTGKDGLYSLYLLKRHNYDIRCIITISSEDTDSYMYHTPNTNLSKDISDIMGIPLISEYNNDTREEELDALRKAIKRAIAEYGITGISSGAILSNYQRNRLLLLCEEFGISLHSPLWNTVIGGYAKSLIKEGFDIIVTRCSADGLTINDCGRRYDNDFIAKLKKHNISLVGEGGEFETLVLGCPLYEKSIVIKEHHVIDRNNDYIMIIDDYYIG
ncbi:MAG: diphthine--ammonia ligase [Candidatus Woesearchaeota archaeon]